MYLKPSNPRYRTKDELARDVAFILAAPVAFGTRSAVIENAMWTWTVIDGKFFGCRFWSAMAALRYVELGGKGWRKHLRHEHVVPRSALSVMLHKLSRPTAELVRKLFDRFLIGCVVDRLEDAVLNDFRSTMPPEFYDPLHPEFQDAWLRYKRCKIQVLPTAPSKAELHSLIRSRTNVE